MNTDTEFVQRMEYARRGRTRSGCMPVELRPQRVRFPPGGYKPEATPAGLLEVECPTCEVTPGEPCDFSTHKITMLFFCFPGKGYHFHTARYLRRVRGENWKRT